jgi:WD40 repeat protein
MNLCPTCLKEHNIHHDIFDLKNFFPKSLSDKYFEDFKLIQITFFKYINEAKKLFDEKINEKNNDEDTDENLKKELKSSMKTLNAVFETNSEKNHDLIKLISLMFENYYNTIDSSPNFNIIFQLKNLTRFNNCLKPFKYDENISLTENIDIFNEYLKKTFIIKTINTPLEIKEIIRIPKLNNTRVLMYLGGTKLCSGNWEANIQIFDLNTKNITRTISGHFSGINSMCLINNKYILSGGCDAAMNIYDPNPEIDESKLNEDNEEQEICFRGFINGHDDTISKIIQFKDGKVATCGYDKKINIFGKILNNKLKDDFPVIELTEEEKEKLEKEKLEKEKLNNNTENKEEGKEEEIQNEEEIKKEEVFYLSLEKLKTFELPNKIFDICELKDGSLMSCCLDKTLRIYNMEKLKEEKVIKIDFVPNRIACLSDGRIVVAFGDRDKFGIKIFKLNENKELNLEKELSEHTKYISSLFILEDGKIVTTSLDGTAVFYNPFEMKIVCKIQEKKRKNFTSVAQFEDRSVIMSSPKGVIYVLQ